MKNVRPVLFGIASIFSYVSIAQNPNVVIIYADDMGYGDLGIQNPQSKIPTPNLDKLASEGIRFTNAHSSSGICTPSRYALLTGRYHWRKFHDIVDSWDPSVFDKAEYTLPQMLKQNGYRTACIGKWHLGWDWTAIRRPDAKPINVNGTNTYNPEDFDWEKPVPDGPTSHGFDYYFGDDVPNFPPYCWFENDKVIDIPTEMLNITEKLDEGDWEARPGPSCKNWDFHLVLPTVTRKATEWIRKQKKGKPFFLYFALTSPHAPIVPTKEWKGKSGAGAYGDYMMQSDWCIGEILKVLKEHGFENNTIVIFSSDNGPEYYAYDRILNFDHRSMGDLRGLKRDIWEGGHRVPFVIKWPGIITRGAVSAELISQTDLMATLAAVIGVTLPEGAAEDSKNQIQLIKGISGSSRTSMVHNTFEKYALQKGKWVFVDASDGEHTQMPEWFRLSNGYVKDTSSSALYDLSTDISQHNNLINLFPQKAEELRSELKKILLKAD
jgi:arylsulfatase A